MFLSFDSWASFTGSELLALAGAVTFYTLTRAFIVELVAFTKALASF